MLKKMYISVLLCTFCLAMNAFGIDTFFTGAGGDQAWENSANWSDGVIPTLSDLANINADCEVGSGITANCSSLQQATDALTISLTIRSDGKLNVQDECNLSTDPNGNSNIVFNVIDTASVTAGTKLRIGDYGTASAYIGNDANISAGMLFVGTFDDANATFIIDGGTVSQTSPSEHVRLAWDPDTTGTLTINDGQLNTAGGMLVGVWGNGIFNVNGGETNIGTNFYIGYGESFPKGPSTGQMTVTNGIVNVLNAFHIGEDGTGFLNMNGGTINIGGAAYSNFVLGLSSGVGTLTMQGGTINVNAPFYVGYAFSGEGHIDLKGGTINVNHADFSINNFSSIDFSGGTLVLSGDKTQVIDDYITEGLITSWGGARTVSVVYEVQTNKTIIKADADSLDAAWNPIPSDEGVLAGADKDNVSARVLWSSGDNASQHDIYFGSSFEDVNDANNSLPPGSSVYKGRQASNTYDPGTLQMGETYYWRIDEVDSNGAIIWKGSVWQFTVSDYYLIDDFESYSNTTELQAVWTNSAALELTIRNGEKSLVFTGPNSVSRNTPLGDWTSYSIEAIQIAYHGDELNTGNAQQMYVKLEDGTSNYTVSFDGDPNGLKQADWQPFYLWHVDLSEFSGINFSNITKITIGTASTDKIYIDDIRLYIPRCLPEKTISDLNSDCNVDYSDLLLIAADWLRSVETITGVNPGTAGLRVWYKFDETNPFLQPVDSSGNGYTGTIGAGQLAIWDSSGYDAGCLVFQGTYGVIVPPEAFSSVDDAVTISMWVNGDSSLPITDFHVLFHGNKLGVDRVLLSHCPDQFGRILFHAGNDPLHLPFPFDISVYQAQSASEFKGQWNHYAFVKDISGGVQRIYINGVLKAETPNAMAPLDGITEFALGSNVGGGSTGSYYGKLDDCKIYDRALSQAEIVYLADKASVQQPLISEADAIEDGNINFEDFAAMAQKWFEMDILWPF